MGSPIQEELARHLKELRDTLNGLPAQIRKGLAEAKKFCDDWHIPVFPPSLWDDAEGAVKKLEEQLATFSAWVDKICKEIDKCTSMREMESRFKAFSIDDWVNTLTVDNLVGKPQDWRSANRESYKGKVEAMQPLAKAIDTALENLPTCVGSVAKAVEDYHTNLNNSVIGLIASAAGVALSVAGLGTPVAPVAVAGLIVSLAGYAWSVYCLCTTQPPFGVESTEAGRLDGFAKGIAGSKWPDLPDLGYGW